MLDTVIPSKPTESALPARGLKPDVLLAQVKNTAPFLWTEGCAQNQEYAQTLTTAANPATHLEYFKLCLSAHWATVATFVPTDVDNAIRFKLWNPSLPIETLREMAALTLRARHWDFSPVSARVIRSEKTGKLLSGHLGEWFSVAAGAYGALRKKDAALAAQIGDAILDELFQHEAFYLVCKKRDGLDRLRAATVITHNLGDLNRVFDAWNIPDEDPLKAAVYKAGQRKLKLFGDAFAEAFELNRLCMADENHRFFALRGPRALRQSAAFLLPIGPFFDDWGAHVAATLAPEQVAEVVHALMDGIEKLRVAVGYTRALAGILDRFPGGFKELELYLPARVTRALKAGPLRRACDLPKERFLEQWRRKTRA